jgi:hypothetical protein
MLHYYTMRVYAKIVPFLFSVLGISRIYTSNYFIIKRIKLKNIICFYQLLNKGWKEVFVVRVKRTIVRRVRKGRAGDASIRIF